MYIRPDRLCQAKGERPECLISITIQIRNSIPRTFLYPSSTQSLKPPNAHDLFLFEFDTRFNVYKRQFIHYDYNNPLGFPRIDELQGSMDFIIVDPPFLSEECATKTLETVKFLARDGCKILMCTGGPDESVVFGGDGEGPAIIWFHTRSNSLLNPTDHPITPKRRRHAFAGGVHDWRENDCISSASPRRAGKRVPMLHQLRQPGDAVG